MRKNYFAKKFVAYSMAFAVAFSTLTVSPVFVKEAKADTQLLTETASQPFTVVGYTNTDLVGTTTPSVIPPVKALLQSVETTAATSTVSVGDIAKNEGLVVSDVKVVDLVTSPNSSQNTALNGNATVKFDDMKIATTINAGSANDYGPNSSANTIFVVNGQTKDASGTTINITTTNSNKKWFKLDKVTNTLTRGAAGTETVSYVMYKATEVTDADASDNKLDLGTVENNDFGYYISEEGILYNVVEISDLVVNPERTTYEAKKGSSVTLTVNARSSKGNLTYTWKKGTTKLSETTGSLTIEDVDNTKTGPYTCIVSDGVCSKDVTMQLSIATADTKRPIVYQSFARYVQAGETGAYKLPGGVTTLKSCVPSQEDYRYIWLVTTAATNNDGTSSNEVAQGNVSRTTVDALNYDAKSSTVTITDDKEYSDAVVTCYVLYKDTYEALHNGGDTIGELLEDLEKTSNDVDKNAIKTKILAIESANATALNTVANPTDLGKKVLYKENFKFISEDNEVQSAEYITKSVGDSVAITLPSKESFIDGANVTSVTFDDGVPGTKELSNDFARTQLVASDFGHQRIYVKAATGTFAGNPTKEVLTEKYVNIVYTPDLTVSAENATAKVGDKVQLAVKADSKLPVSYAWEKVTTTPTGKLGDVTDPSKLTISSVATDDLYIPEELYVDGSKKVEEANYYLCTVDNGIEQKKVKITISKNGGFEYKDVEADPFVTDKEESYTKYALANTNTSFAPIVKEGTGAKLTYAWYKYAVGTEVISTDKKLTVDFDGKADVRYVLVITDEASSQKATINYTLKTLKTEDIVHLSIDRTVPAQKYTGSEIKPQFDLNVSIDGNDNGTYEPANDTTYVLASTDLTGTDFNVAYENNVNTGVARIIVTVAKQGTTSNTYTAKAEFYIDRADNEVQIADKSVILGQSVQPKTIKNVAKSALTYEYFTDAACTNEIEVPSKVGTYYVKAISAATANYNDATSNVAKIVIAPSTTKVTKVATNANAVKLTWSKVTGATAYRVYIKKSGKWTKVADTKSLTYTVKKLASATKYQFAVKAFAGSIASPKYVTKTAYTTPAKVATPAVKAKGRGKVAVSYGKVTRATGYQVYMAKGNGSYKKVAQGKLTAITKSKLTKGATYKFKVRAYKKVGSNVYYGAFSSAKAVKVK